MTSNQYKEMIPTTKLMTVITNAVIGFQLFFPFLIFTRAIIETVVLAINKMISKTGIHPNTAATIPNINDALANPLYVGVCFGAFTTTGSG